jgi:hypothetical protein
MAIPLRPARVHIDRQNGRYVVDRIDLANSARTKWVTMNHVGGTYDTIQELKRIERPSLIGTGFFPVTFRWHDR